jgi:hypothetical protein
LRRAVCFLTITLAVLACGKSPEERARDVGICSDTADAGRIATCLRGRGWDSLPAESAGAIRAAVLDSMFRWQADSTWRADDATHAADVRRCAGRRGDLAQCLRLVGWPADRATAVAESLWNTRSEEHRRQVERCVRGSAGGNIADCLMLYYKWDATRALAANDSVQRARATR